MKYPILHIGLPGLREKREKDGFRGGGSKDEDRLETAKSDATSEVW